MLIAPYLPMFFKHQNLLEGADFRDEAAMGKAIQLLHYLATGTPDMPLDTDLVFEKWLCNTPLSKTTNRQ